MKTDVTLPPLPIAESCPVQLVIEYGRGFLAPTLVASHSTVALEPLRAKRSVTDGFRSFVLISSRHNCRYLLGMLNRNLRREMIVPRTDETSELARGSVQAVFARMAFQNESVWFWPMLEAGGAAVFVRRATDDPNLERILHFNRRCRHPLFKITNMTVVTRDRPESGNEPNGENPPQRLMHAALHFRVANKSAFRRLTRRR